MIRLLLAACLATAAIAPAAAQAPQAAVLSDTEQAQILRVQDFLNGIHTLKAHFTQVGQDGKITEGTAWLQRPGKMRFEYAKPSPLLLVAGGGTVYFRDNQLGQTTTIPLTQTPLGLLLADHIALNGAVTVTNYRALPGALQLTLVRTATPGDGTLTLALETAPLSLTGWTVVDAEGHETRVQLTDVTLGGSFDPALFVFHDPDADQDGK